MEQPKALTVAQVAEQLQVGTKIVYELLRNGKLRGKRIGRLWRVSEEALAEFLRENGRPKPCP